MRVKSFKGENAASVMAQVKAALGSDAVILNTQTLTENGRSYCEITAGVDEDGASMGATPRSALADPGRSWLREWREIRECLISLAGNQLDMSRLTPRQRQALDYLEREEGLDRKVVLFLYQRLTNDPQNSILSALTDIVAVKPWGCRAWPETMHAMAGPSGCGKTSMLIRMALMLKRESPSANICLVNADDRQAKGRLILRHYAELSGFSYRELSSREDFTQLMAESEAFQRIFIDLPASSAGESYDEKIARFGLLDLRDLCIHLVLSPVYGTPQIERYLEIFSRIPLSSIVWTKLDEACAYGALVNAAEACALPASALSFGTGFKDTLVAAEYSHLWKLLFKHALPNASGGYSDGA